MFDIKLLVTVTAGFTLSGADRFLQLFGETIDVHTLIIGQAAGIDDIHDPARPPSPSG
jgi:hypothetical protein